MASRSEPPKRRRHSYTSHPLCTLLDVSPQTLSCLLASKHLRRIFRSFKRHCADREKTPTLGDVEREIAHLQMKGSTFLPPSKHWTAEKHWAYFILCLQESAERGGFLLCDDGNNGIAGSPRASSSQVTTAAKDGHGSGNAKGKGESGDGHDEHECGYSRDGHDLDSMPQTDLGEQILGNAAWADPRPWRPSTSHDGWWEGHFELLRCLNGGHGNAEFGLRLAGSGGSSSARGRGRGSGAFASSSSPSSCAKSSGSSNSDTDGDGENEIGPYGFTSLFYDGDGDLGGIGDDGIQRGWFGGPSTAKVVNENVVRLETERRRDIRDTVERKKAGRKEEEELMTGVKGIVVRLDSDSSNH
ncbi:hypothetical protein MKZ38_001247 [Zalerion maritima]|uniref:Uncharacterized protein n=1 Tax=Zalerion maritima TaxID=339359 RepID=A0AAD5RQM7_9PEZI|nr:hypothetical protein MKZ38_001247 [Zalerion maritima]